MRSKICFATVASLLSFLIAGCSHPHVNARVWDLERDTPKGHKGNYYPEIHDDAVKIPKIVEHDKATKTFGIAFSGGGTRAASAALGQMRALKKLGWLEKADYISAISGGSWEVIPYLYFKPELFPGLKDPETAFLGEYVPPEEITDEKLACTESAGGRDATCNTLRFSKVVSEAKVAKRAKEGWLEREGDETYAHVLASIFLEPYGLGCKDCFFTWDDARRNTIVAQNSTDPDKHFSLRQDGIMTVRNGKGPFPIIGAALMPNKSGDYRDFFPVEFTPLYSGSRTRASYPRPEYVNENDFPTMRVVPIPVGGGYVESVAYDSDYPVAGLASPTQTFVLKKETRAFSLRDVIAASGAAPQAFLHKINFTDVGFPEFNYYHINVGYPYAEHALDEKREYSHGDGGHLDNLGLMPLLARKVKNILVFANTLTPFGYDEKSKTFSIDHNVTSFFDVRTHEKEKRYPHNVVFDPAAYKKLLTAYRNSNDKQQPLVYCDKFAVRKNTFWDINEPYEANICWVYLDKNQKWIDALPGEQFARLTDRSNEGFEEFQRFPHYRTFFEDHAIIDLTEPQVNMLAALTGWSVMESKATIKSVLGLPN